jgi:hypothetical protein
MLRQLNKLFGFGFGLIDRWVFVYAASTAINGVGIGMLVMDALRRGRIEIDPLICVALFFAVSGLLSANVAHSALKKKAAANLPDRSA